MVDNNIISTASYARQRLRGTLLLNMDIKKAYDNVPLSVLDEMISSRCNDPEVLDQWKRELMDLKTLNYRVSNATDILRTDGLPQGSELAPLLFNYYTTIILQDPAIQNTIGRYGLTLQIYADNWIITK